MYAPLMKVFVNIFLNVTSLHKRYIIFYNIFLQYFKVIKKYINKKCFYLFQNFICKICKFLADSKDKIIDHVTEAHSGKEDLDKHSDFEKDEADEDSSEEDVIKFDVKKKYRSSKQTQINSDGTSMFNRYILSQ